MEIEAQSTTSSTVINQKSRIWEKEKLDDYDLTAAEMYESKVIRGRIDNSKITDFEMVIEEEEFPTGDERCQEWIK